MTYCSPITGRPELYRATTGHRKGNADLRCFQEDSFRSEGCFWREDGGAQGARAEARGATYHNESQFQRFTDRLQPIASYYPASQRR